MSEMVRAIVNGLSAVCGGQEVFPKSWKEMEEYKPETRSAEEIKSMIINKLHALGE